MHSMRTHERKGISVLQNLVGLVECEALPVPDAAIHPWLGRYESLHIVDVRHQLVPDNLLRQSCVVVYVYQHDVGGCNKHTQQSM